MLIIDNAIVDSVNDWWAPSNTGGMAPKIWPRLGERRTMSLLKVQRGALNIVTGVVTGHCIMGTHVRRIDRRHLANNFCRSCRYEEEDETVPYLLRTARFFAKGETSTSVHTTWMIWRNWRK